MGLLIYFQLYDSYVNSQLERVEYPHYEVKFAVCLCFLTCFSLRHFVLCLFKDIDSHIDIHKPPVCLDYLIILPQTGRLRYTVFWFSVPVCVRPSITLCVLNILKSH